MMGSRNSLSRQTPGSTFSSGKRKKNKQSCSLWRFFSGGRTLLTHAAPERQQRYTGGVNHTLTQCIPAFPLSFVFLSFLFFLWGPEGYGGGYGGDGGACENKNPGRKRERRERGEDRKGERRNRRRKGGQKLRRRRHEWTA